MLRLYIAFCASAITCFGTQESYIVKTSAKENPSAIFRCRVPARYDQASKVKYRLLVYFGGRNTTGEHEAKNPTWANWCDKNEVFLIVPSYKNDNYWEPQKWSGKALLEAIAQLKKKYPNICDDKLLFYGYSAGAQCARCREASVATILWRRWTDLSVRTLPELSPQS